MPSRDGRGSGPSRGPRRGILAVLFGAAMLLLATETTRAEFRVCNRTGSLINIAVGYNGDDDFQTEGWWTITAASCVVPIKEALKGRYVYLYATDVDANDVLQGTFTMCIEKRKFLLVGINDCWRRGLLAVNFAEVDTLSSPSWTVFLGEAAR